MVRKEDESASGGGDSGYLGMHGRGIFSSDRMQEWIQGDEVAATQFGHDFIDGWNGIRYRIETTSPRDFCSDRVADLIEDQPGRVEAIAKMLFAASFQGGGCESCTMYDHKSGLLLVSNDEERKTSIEMPFASFIAPLYRLPQKPIPIISHYHPNKDASPSEDDDAATCAMAFIFDRMEVSIADHWIFGCDGSVYSYSLNDPGCLTPDVEFSPRVR